MATGAAAEMDETRPTSTSERLDVSGYVRRTRRLADLSQRDLADALGVSQPTVSRMERGGGISLREFERVLATAGLRLAVVDEAGDTVEPMPTDVFRDRGGRRRPAHLDVHSAPETPTIKMLLHSVDPVPEGGAWHHHREERDRLRAKVGADAHGEQLTLSSARERRFRAQREAFLRRRRQIG